jgi:hypothetical protein
MHTPELAPHPSRRRRKGQRSSRSKRGRLLLVAIFVAFRVSDALMFFAAGPHDKTQLVTSLITSAVWTTALLVAIAYRQNWARYILIFLLILGVAFFLIVAPVILKDEVDNPAMVPVLCITALINALSAWCLISASSIRRLTNSNHE